MPYLLDTNIVSHLTYEPRGKIANKIIEVGEAEVCTSIIVAGELWYGVEKRKSEMLKIRIERTLQLLEVVAFAPPAHLLYGALRAELEAAGTPIGAYDLLIAAHALSLGYTLVTDNEREFKRVSRLRVENWLRN